MVISVLQDRIAYGSDVEGTTVAKTVNNGGNNDGNNGGNNDSDNSNAINNI